MARPIAVGFGGTPFQDEGYGHFRGRSMFRNSDPMGYPRAHSFDEALDRREFMPPPPRRAISPGPPPIHIRRERQELGVHMRQKYHDEHFQEEHSLSQNIVQVQHNASHNIRGNMKKGSWEAYISCGDPKHVYRSGEWVHGEFVLEVGPTAPITAIYLKLCLGAEVSWTETSGSSDNRTTTYYSDSETFLAATVCLFGTENPRGRLISGMNIYSFQFRLPNNLPSSFSGESGKIAYYVEAVIERKGFLMKTRENRRWDFTVLGNVDLSRIPEARMPVEGHNEKMVGCLCPTGPVTASMWLDRTGYLPGETIFIKAQIENHSNEAFEGSSIQLEQHILYTAEGETNHEVLLASPAIRRGPIAAHSSATYMNELLVVPPVLPYHSLTNPRIIEIGYMLRLTLPATACCDYVPTTIDLPIIIGTPPWDEDFVEPSSVPAAPPVYISDLAGPSKVVHGCVLPAPDYARHVAENTSCVIN